jgi:hypothetical protein
MNDLAQRLSGEAERDQEQFPRARNERRRLKRLHPDAYQDGLLVGMGIKEGSRERGGYPAGFAQW